VGGAPLEYQIDVQNGSARPTAQLGRALRAIARSNYRRRGRGAEEQCEYLVRFVGWVKGKEALENTVVRAPRAGRPCWVKNVAAVQLASSFAGSVC